MIKLPKKVFVLKQKAKGKTFYRLSWLSNGQEGEKSYEYRRVEKDSEPETVEEIKETPAEEVNNAGDQLWQAFIDHYNNMREDDEDKFKGGSVVRLTKKNRERLNRLKTISGSNYVMHVSANVIIDMFFETILQDRQKKGKLT